MSNTPLSTRSSRHVHAVSKLAFSFLLKVSQWAHIIFDVITIIAFLIERVRLNLAHEYFEHSILLFSIKQRFVFHPTLWPNSWFLKRGWNQNAKPWFRVFLYLLLLLFFYRFIVSIILFHIKLSRWSMWVTRASSWETIQTYQLWE